MFESHSKLVKYWSFKTVPDLTYNAQTSVFDKFGIRLKNTICNYLTDGTLYDRLMSTVQIENARNKELAKKNKIQNRGQQEAWTQY